MPPALCWPLAVLASRRLGRADGGHSAADCAVASDGRELSGQRDEGRGLGAAHRSFARRRHPARLASQPGHHSERHADGRRARAAAEPVAIAAALGGLQRQGNGDADRSARRRAAHSRLPGHHRAVRLYRCARLAQLVAGQRSFAAQLSGRAAQLCRRATVRRRMRATWWC